MWPNLQETADLVTFTEKIFNEKRAFLFSDDSECKGLLGVLQMPKMTSQMIGVDSALYKPEYVFPHYCLYQGRRKINLSIKVPIT